MTSYSFHDSLVWVGNTTDLHYVNYIAAPYGTTHTSFQALFWIMFALAFSPYIYVIAIRALIWYKIIREGDEVSEQFVQDYQTPIYSALLFLVSVLYFPVLSLLSAGLDCRFSDALQTNSRLDYDAQIVCWKGNHIAMLVCALLAIIAYYPASSFAQAQAQAITDVHFHPRIIFLQLQAKFVLVVLATFLRRRTFWGYIIVVLAVNVLFLLLSFYRSSCSIRWLRRTRTVFFTVGTWSAIAAIICYKLTTSHRWIALLILLLGWAVVVPLCLVGFWLYDHFLADLPLVQSLEQLLTFGIF